MRRGPCGGQGPATTSSTRWSSSSGRRFNRMDRLWRPSRRRWIRGWAHSRVRRRSVARMWRPRRIIRRAVTRVVSWRASAPIRVPDINVVPVVDVASTPMHAPSIPAPAAAAVIDHRSDRDSHAEGNYRRRRQVSRGISRHHHGRSVNRRRVVGRDIHHLGIRWLNHNHIRTLLHHLDFFRGLQISLLKRLRTHPLHGCHHIGLLHRCSLS